MTARLRLSLLGALVASLLLAIPVRAQTAGCQFVLGFKALHELDPVDIGGCLEDETAAANGDVQQHTTRGLMVWRKADNLTAFTNGYLTWINGPNGLVTRLNSERLPFEHDQASDYPAGILEQTFDWQDVQLRNGLTVLFLSGTGGSAPGVFQNMRFAPADAGKSVAVEILAVKSKTGADMAAIDVHLFESFIGPAQAGDQYGPWYSAVPGQPSETRVREVGLTRVGPAIYQWQARAGDFFLLLANRIASGMPASDFPGSVRYRVDVT